MVSTRLVGVAVALLALLALAAGYQVYSFEQRVQTDQQVLFQQVSILNREQFNQLANLTAELQNQPNALHGCFIIDPSNLGVVDPNRYYVLVAFDLSSGNLVPLVCPK